MSSKTNNTFVALLAVSTGVAVTFSIARLVAQDDLELLAAEQRFSQLEYSEARRIKATFDYLENKPKERKHIETVHSAVTTDADLNRQLQLLYAWWTTRDGAQRAELRELPAEKWLEEMQRQLSQSPGTDSISVQLPGRDVRGGPAQVSRQQIDRFLEDALPADELPAEDKALLKSVTPEDQSLARVLVIARGLFRRRSGGPGMNPSAVERTFNAAKTHLLPERIPENRRDRREEVMISFAVLKSILRSVTDHLGEDFLRRHAVSSEAMEQKFADLEISERIKHMMSDPATVVRSLQAHLNSVHKDTPSGQLAARLEEASRTAVDLREKLQRGPRAPGSNRGGRAPGGRLDQYRGPEKDRSRGFRPLPNRRQK